MNIPFKLNTNAELLSKVTELKGSGQVVFANYYGLNDHEV